MIPLSTILEIIKKYWYVPLFLGYVIYSQIHSYQLKKQYEGMLDSYQAQIESNKKIFEEEKQQKDVVLEEYKNNINKLEEQYSNQQKELEDLRQKRIKVIIRYYENPELLSSKIIELYKFEYVKK